MVITFEMKWLILTVQYIYGLFTIIDMNTVNDFLA
jgi:hypothetical protein